MHSSCVHSCSIYTVLFNTEERCFWLKTVIHKSGTFKNSNKNRYRDENAGQSSRRICKQWKQKFCSELEQCSMMKTTHIQLVFSQQYSNRSWNNYSIFSISIYEFRWHIEMSSLFQMNSYENHERSSQRYFRVMRKFFSWWNTCELRDIEFWISLRPATHVIQKKILYCCGYTLNPKIVFFSLEIIDSSKQWKLQKNGKNLNSSINGHTYFSLKTATTVWKPLDL